ncbi:DsbA family protein [Ghiorsea bivora]|uniref:DsbA family protein n=1 Tax=Ghiorsea bivora TaxID=1485545 RepID=UPI000571964D|nr:DsbA family protein [Ghiorsea bivora]
MATLYYIHDPMCSWCWAFRPVFTELLNKLPDDIDVKYLVGGLAPDSSEPMDKATQAMIQKHWRTIQIKVPNSQFNFGFWTNNTPRRSTYPACRAVLAAKAINPNKEDTMIFAIQQAYYLNALNPSDDDVLIECAASIGLDTAVFAQTLNSPATQQALQENIQKSQSLGVYSFPSLVLEENGRFKPITIDYNHVDNILSQFQ